MLNPEYIKYKNLLEKFKKYKKNGYCFSCKKYTNPPNKDSPRCLCTNPTNWSFR